MTTRESAVAAALAVPIDGGGAYLPICQPCIDGEGSECHTPGCALWMRDVPPDGLQEAMALDPAAVLAALDTTPQPAHKTSQPQGLGNQEGEPDGNKLGVHPGRTRQDAEGPGGRGLHGGSGVLARPGSDPARGRTEGSGRGLSDSTPTGHEPVGVVARADQPTPQPAPAQLSDDADELAEWLGAMDEARNVFDITDEATTVLTIDVETLAKRLTARAHQPSPQPALGDDERAALSEDEVETLTDAVYAPMILPAVIAAVECILTARARQPTPPTGQCICHGAERPHAPHQPCDMGCQPDWHRDDCAIYLPAAPTPPAQAEAVATDVLFGAAVGWQLAHDEVCRLGPICSAHQPIEADAQRPRLLAAITARRSPDYDPLTTARAIADTAAAVQSPDTAARMRRTGGD